MYVPCVVVALAVAFAISGCGTTETDHNISVVAADTAAADTAAADTAAADTAAADTAASDVTTADADALADAGDDAQVDVVDVGIADADADVADADVVEAEILVDADAADADALDIDEAGTVDADAADPDVADPDVAETATDATDTAAADVYTPPPATAPIDPSLLPATAFTDVTTDFGIDPSKAHSICVAAGDLNDDGREDLLMIERANTQATIHVVLLGKSGISHVKTPVDTTLLLPTSGCSLADMNNDGTPDLLVGGQSGAALYMGDGKGGFTDKSAEWLPYIMDFSAWSIGAVDLDGDGDLDIFVGAGSPSFDNGNPGPGPACGSEKCGYDGDDFTCALKTQVPSIAELNNRVFIRGPKLPMVDDSAAWKVPPGGLLSAGQPLDVDLDGKMDVFVCDDFGVHYLLHNVGGAFEVLSTAIGFYPYAHGMGWGVGDFNSDGKVDLVLADVGPSPFYVQQAAQVGKPAFFADQGKALGAWWPVWSSSSWSPLVADFDLDGHDDVMFGGALNTTPENLGPVTAGCTKDGKSPYAGNANIDVLLRNDGKGGFYGERFAGGLVSHFMAISQVVVDIDDDGDLDILQSRPHYSLTSSVRVLRNDLVKQGKRMRVVVTGKGGNLDALGAIVSAKVGGKLRTRWLSGSSGFGGGRRKIADFGLGSADKATDVQVRWPDGSVSKLGDIKADAVVLATWK